MLSQRRRVAILEKYAEHQKEAFNIFRAAKGSPVMAREAARAASRPLSRLSSSSAAARVSSRTADEVAKLDNPKSTASKVVAKLRERGRTKKKARSMMGLRTSKLPEGFAVVSPKR